MACSTHVNAQTQCSFNQPLGFDPQLFPSLPIQDGYGYDGNNYPSEDAALNAER